MPLHPYLCISLCLKSCLVGFPQRCHIHLQSNQALLQARGLQSQICMKPLHLQDHCPVHPLVAEAISLEVLQCTLGQASPVHAWDKLVLTGTM